MLTAVALAAAGLVATVPGTAGATDSRPNQGTGGPLVAPAGNTVTLALLVPGAGPAMVAPSYGDWLVEPPAASLPTEHFVARPPAPGTATHFQKSAAPAAAMAAAPAPAMAAAIVATPAPVLAVVPLPPKRLAEKRIVLASIAPLPPPRAAEPEASEPPTTESLAFAPPPPAAGMTLLRPPKTEAAPEAEAAPEDEPAGAEQEDAARPIDDTPEPAATRATADRAPPHIEALIERHAARYDVPTWLVRRVAWRESKFEPTRRNGPYWGLMQIRVDTARALGFRGEPKDLLDADTNMTYAVAYLANAYRTAGRDETRAVVLYSKGYYYEAKRKRLLASLIRTASTETAKPAAEGEAASDGATDAAPPVQ
ncbi:lytic transglycosylase domain-containing protein [Ancylobacter sp. WKF20]|uniref:lytic transglycosylase domain-containing protein n=1 Tax=Ancylobacter sp. WKF20 TaxID=3039801 RepID=UPI00243429C8|nr:lytic transglycosylase domain-containing protein [Ancylobacter sp. WKF20]WGD29095.1 lytic transglycosylase domain-containing protein [Ancylobacter sp. WKF20]